MGLLRRNRGMRRAAWVLASVAALSTVTVAVGLDSVGLNSAAAAPRVTTITLQARHAFQPVAPTSGGHDIYHCTLVDPRVRSSSMIVSSQFFPEGRDVHHAILFLVPPALASAARQADHNGKGWTCFGESALPGTSASISDTPWLSAWAPGRKLDVVPKGTGVPLPKGSLVVMQIHYNLLDGHAPVRSKLVLNTVPASTHLEPLQLDLLPAPPDLPCPAGVSGPLCDRSASLADSAYRFGPGAAVFVNVIERVCGRDPNNPPGGDSTSCLWPIWDPQQIVRLTAHMHLLGTGMKIVLDPGSARQRTLLDVTNYDFHDQRSYNLATPVKVGRGDALQVTCTYDPTLRQKLPELRNLPPRYVTWGDGSSDEMCLGLVQSLPG